MLEKLKSLVLSDHIFYGVLVILSGFGGYSIGIGYSLEQANSETFVPEEYTKSAVLPSREVTQGGVQPVSQAEKPAVLLDAVVASKTGSRYHLLGCPGAAQIKPDNLLTFGSQEEAEAAGYKPAANCPGLVQ
jgi:hypothetical protein